MSRFKVSVECDEPMKAWERLDRAGVPTLGPAYAEFVGAPDTGTWSRCMLAVVDADSSQAAEGQVREAVGDGVDVGSAEALTGT